MDASGLAAGPRSDAARAGPAAAALGGGDRGEVQPRALLGLGIALGVAALALVWSVPVAGGILGVPAAACLLGVRPYTRYRDRLLARARGRRPMYPESGETVPPPGPAPAPRASGRNNGEETW